MAVGRPKGETTEGVLIRLAPEMWEAIKAAAAENDRTVSGEVRRRLRQSLDADNPPSMIRNEVSINDTAGVRRVLNAVSSKRLK